MVLTGPQSQKLRDAVLSGFSVNELEQLMLFEMNVRLWDNIPPGPLATVAFNLINWCAAQGRVDEFLTAVAKLRPANRTVQQAIADLRGELGLDATAGGEPSGTPAPPTSASTPAVSPANVGSVLARVRQLLLSLYPDLDEFVLLFEDTLGTRFESVAGTGKPPVQMHELVKWANANRAFRLCPLLAAVEAQHPNSDELKSLRQALCQA